MTREQALRETLIAARDANKCLIGVLDPSEIVRNRKHWLSYARIFLAEILVRFLETRTRGQWQDIFCPLAQALSEIYSGREINDWDLPHIRKAAEMLQGLINLCRQQLEIFDAPKGGIA